VIAYFYSRRIDLPLSRFLPVSDLTSARLEDGEAVVFLDDFVGSGRNVVHLWGDYVAKLAAERPRRRNPESVSHGRPPGSDLSPKASATGKS
jgi:hypothetical protein